MWGVAAWSPGRFERRAARRGQRARRVSPPRTTQPLWRLRDSPSRGCAQAQRRVLPSGITGGSTIRSSASATWASRDRGTREGPPQERRTEAYDFHRTVPRRSASAAHSIDDGLLRQFDCLTTPPPAAGLRRRSVFRRTLGAIDHEESTGPFSPCSFAVTPRHRTRRKLSNRRGIRTESASGARCEACGDCNCR